MTRFAAQAALGIGLLAAVPDTLADETGTFRLPASIRTHGDGRAGIEQLYESYLTLRERGWEIDVIANSAPAGTESALPIIALRTPRGGDALWVFAGIHGEEPAGPNAVAVAIDDLGELGERHPVVLVPLCNPHGYARNWRYLNTPLYSAAIEGQSVGDSSHLLPDPGEP